MRSKSVFEIEEKDLKAKTYGVIIVQGSLEHTVQSFANFSFQTRQKMQRGPL